MVTVDFWNFVDGNFNDDYGDDDANGHEQEESTKHENNG